MIIRTLGSSGISYFPIEVESDIRPGLFRFDIIGLADKSIEESKLRILSAIRNSKLLSSKNQNYKIVVLLCPAHIKKEGTHFDLAIAISCLQSLQSIKIVNDGWIYFGELGLKGDLRSVSRLPKMISQSKEFGFTKFIVPEVDYDHIKNISGIHLYAAKNLKDAVSFLTNSSHENRSIYNTPDKAVNTKGVWENEEFIIDIIKNQPLAKRALEISLAGKHNILFYGPPGTGKSLFANSAKEFFKYIHLAEFGIAENTKFRSPHHTISNTQLIGNKNKIGEIHLAHEGILFLDEIPEFNRRSLESLRQPLETGEVEFDGTAEGTNTDSKADFTLIATSNLCKCGYLESGIKNCTCGALQIKQYKSRLSGPILDRIDLCVFLKDSKSNFSISNPQKDNHVNLGKNILLRIIETREIQKDRVNHILQNTNKTNHTSKKIRNLYLNREIESKLNKVDSAQIRRVLQELSVSKRREDSILRVALTISDLEKSPDIRLEHIIEAASYRARL